MATDRLINKDQGDDIIDALSDIATNINTITYGPQTSADKVVSMTGYVKAGTADAISQGDTLNEAVGKLEKKADDNAIAIDGKTAGPESATVGDIATFNNASGKVLNDSGVAIATSVDDTKDTEVPTSKAVGTYVSGKGYATGVATSTANHLVTFNGTDGKALKDGGATIAFDATGVQNDDTAIPTSKAVQSYVTGKHYAGSSSDGGAATSADKLNIGNSNIGSATQPVYFDKTTGKPVAITNTIQSNVPANAVFTDTTYTVAEGTQNGKIKVTPSAGSAYEVPVHGLGNAAYKGVADTVSTSTDLVTSNAVNTKLASYVPNSDLIGIVNNSAKNIVPVYGSVTQKVTSSLSITWTADSDGYISADPNNSDPRNFVFENCQYTFQLEENQSYELVIDVKTASTNTAAEIDLINSSGGRVITKLMKNVTGRYTQQFSIGSGDGGLYGLCLKTYEGVWRIMICAKPQFNISDEYEPYALGNQVLTPELIELCDSEAKNLFTTSLSTQEFNVTAVSENDTTGTISCQSNGAWARMAHRIKLPAGSYIVSFKVTAHGSNSVIFGDSQFDGQGTHLFWCENLQNTSYTISITTTTTATWYLAFAANQSNTSSTTDVLTVTEFMICTKAAFSVSQKFVPYRPNYDLVAMGNWTKIEKEYTSTAADTYEYSGVSVTVPADQLYEIIASDRVVNTVPMGILISDVNTDLTLSATVVAENSSAYSVADSAIWTRQVHCITPRTYNTAHTYYVWVKRKTAVKNGILLLYRRIY